MKIVSNIYWIIGALLMAVFFRSFVVSVFKIPSASMTPTLLAGDFILSSQTAYRTQLPFSDQVYSRSSPARGDLIVFQFSPKKAAAKSMAQYLKRVVGTEGDEIEIVEGRLILNGKPCGYEPITIAGQAASTQVFTETCVGMPSHQIVFKLENTNKALDSFPKETVPAGEVYVLGDNRSILDDSRTLGTLLIDQIASKVSLIWFSFGSTQDFISGPSQIRWNRILTKPL